MHQHASMTEAGVAYILAKGYQSKALGMLGFPAYDQAMYLIGFYRDSGQTQQGGGGQLVFVPNAQINGLTEMDVQYPREILSEQISLKSYSVFTLQKCGNSLQRMKDEAALYYWSKCHMSSAPGR
ncbi:unnamed protein product [Chrysoparadoxa australica]